MSTQPAVNPLHQYRSSGNDVQHSKEKALTEREFELLLEGARELGRQDYYYKHDPELVVYVLGRLGLRRGELVHLDESWINWRESMIEIPTYSPCTGGRDGGPCGECRQSARQRVDHADGDLTVEEALNWMWTPKTEAGSRKVYFGHDTRAQMYLERYFAADAYTRFEASGSAVTRRIDRAAEEAPELSPGITTPHGLRSTAASHMAGRGLGVYQLCQIMGWVKTSTAEAYVSRNSTSTAKALDGLDT